jgi:hypothetical protein
MQAETTSDYVRARRAYELGRLRTSVQRAVLVAIGVALVTWGASGLASLAWLPATLAIWMFAYWRGAALLRGAFYGLAGGVVTLLLPMSVLRPCCGPGVMAGCCHMPGACMAAGAVVGAVLAALVPFGKASWWRTAAGIALGIASVAIFKCAGLLAGEAFGLVGGLAAGLAAASLAKVVLAQRSTV